MGGTDGLILSGDDDSESEDDNDLADAEQAKRKSKKKGKKDKKKKRGRLINKIENELGNDDAGTNAGNEAKEEEKKEESGGTGIRLRKNIGKSRRALDQTINVRIYRLRFKSLCKARTRLPKPWTSSTTTFRPWTRRLRSGEVLIADTAQNSRKKSAKRQSNSLPCTKKLTTWTKR